MVGVLVVALLAGCVLVGSQAVIAVLVSGDAYAGLDGSPAPDPTDDGLTSLADPTESPSSEPTIEPSAVADPSPAIPCPRQMSRSTPAPT